MATKIKSIEDVKKLDYRQQIKYEIAEELGLIDKVFESGWRSLSARETGKDWRTYKKQT